MTDAEVTQFVESLEEHNFAILFNDDNLEAFVSRAIELYPHKPAYKFHALMGK